jgi:glyoxylase-like metal-dependent hydrolase (beta-lactamase superfamily II)
VLSRLLDALWARVPFPYRPYFQEEMLGGVRSVEMSRMFFGRRLMTVRAYMVGDTLVDTGLSCMGKRVVQWAQAHQATRALVTHHHEDHSGNASALLRAGLEVMSSDSTQKLVAAGFPLRFYQHMLWGRASACDMAVLGHEVALGRYTAQVIPAPGHCDDQVVFWVPEEGWLFSGDAFLFEKIKFFRRDEDFAQTVASLETILQLDFDVLYCAHRPRLQQGKRALAQKLSWLRELEGEVRMRYEKGMDVKAITRELFGSAKAMTWLTMGDVSSKRLVESILWGATPRPEIKVILER